MKTYGVSIPLTGTIYVEIEAETEEEAKEKALNSDFSTADIESWDVHEHITQGNVFYGYLNEIDIEEV